MPRRVQQAAPDPNLDREFGAGAAQEAALKQVPLPTQPPPQAVPLRSPSLRPDEPVTAGLGSVPRPDRRQSLRRTLIDAYKVNPSPALLRLIEQSDHQREI